MRRLGMHAGYVEALIKELVPDQATMAATQAGLTMHALLHATPVQRCWSALRVVRGAGA